MMPHGATAPRPSSFKILAPGTLVVPGVCAMSGGAVCGPQSAGLVEVVCFHGLLGVVWLGRVWGFLDLFMSRGRAWFLVTP